MLKLKSIRKKNPRDKFCYRLADGIIPATELILREYGTKNKQTEGLVYWGGVKNNNEITILTVIAPECETGPQFVYTSGSSNAKVVSVLSKRGQIFIGQVHTHPGNWVDHSFGDDKMAPFKYEGLLSLVVPEYGLTGMLPLTKCGMHRYNKGRFERLSEKYIRDHFTLIDRKAEMIDLR